ncbi:MAG: hypothetical protein HY209_06545 [Candidatus Omnitrophica bacterium]|nr:hypothetical protein [Candidatus Omnitrophota bacterium]
MENKQLLEKSARLGYPLLETKENFDVNKALAEMVKTKNVRFLEGFPVMLANAAQEGNFDYHKVEASLGNKKTKENFKQLFLLSLALYKENDFHFASVLTDREKQKVVLLRNSLNHGRHLKVGNYQLNLDRLKQAFRNYFVHKSHELKALDAKHEDMSLEFALSEVFSPKQKELFLKKLKGELLNKTEREYFSRVVRKKAVALANPELHRLAQKVLQLS